MNIWEYQVGSMIKLIDIDNKVYVGEVIHIFDCDELESDADEISVETDSAIYGFRPDEILSIERIENKN